MYVNDLSLILYYMFTEILRKYFKTFKYRKNSNILKILWRGNIYNVIIYYVNKGLSKFKLIKFKSKSVFFNKYF